jgi:hypothetical protein
MNKYLTIFILTVLLLVSTFFNLGCGGPSEPIQSSVWRDDGTGLGYMQFYTNDPSEVSYNFWHRNLNSEYPMKRVVTQVKKISGNANYGFGIIFCYQDSDSFYRLLIDTWGYYSVYEKDGDYFYKIIEWSFSDNLYTGYNTVNKIRVEYSSTTPGTFTIYFNDIYENSFTGSGLTGGDTGFFASTGKYYEERFPNTPVDVRFKQLEPGWSASSIKSLNEAPTNSSEAVLNCTEKAHK